MRHPLHPHPDSRTETVTSIEAEASRPRPGLLALRYVVTGAIGDLRLPPAAAPARGNELWRHTCFEAFLRAPPSGVYYELNFAPSLQWAAYRFTGYRAGMEAAGEVGAPKLIAQTTPQRYELAATIALDQLSDLPADTTWDIALTAVIETADRSKSYWSLAHAPGQPDFHHSVCFAARLNPA
jgi:hypothetical protein